MRRRATGRSLSWVITILQLLLVAALLWFHVVAILKSFGSASWVGFLLSPGIAWTVPYFAILLWLLFANSSSLAYQKPPNSGSSDKSSKSE